MKNSHVPSAAKNPFRVRESGASSRAERIAQYLRELRSDPDARTFGRLSFEAERQIDSEDDCA